MRNVITASPTAEHAFVSVLGECHQATGNATHCRALAQPTPLPRIQPLVDAKAQQG
jgi:hypothetical protein